MTTKNYNLLLLLTSVFFSNMSISQDFTGKAVYKTDRTIEISLDSTKIQADKMNSIQAQLRKAMQKEYELVFTTTASNWRETEKLGEPSVATSGIQIRIAGGGDDSLLYKNTKTQESIETKDVMGKLFLISGAMKALNWEMTPETKQIGKYTCYKAIASREVTNKVAVSVNGERTEEKKTNTETVTAWYTPDIPVNHGPDEFWGLPGLILEVSNGKKMMICTKVVLNSGEQIAIEIPSKGKPVTNEEFKGIMEKQLIMMQKMYGGGKKKGKDSAFTIKIGG
ncbi:GLPGLI family protein [uncultured Croceitalea sp.]|uniref:GLPGLI family protein n=1 Tax=uncultured Croceitalea sp. TaxID=1798908 RepID=UPI0033067B27